MKEFGEVPVDCEVLKAEDVQNSNEGKRLLLANCEVDLLQDPGENSSVQSWKRTRKWC